MALVKERRTVAAGRNFQHVAVVVAVIGFSEERNQRHHVPGVAHVVFGRPAADEVERMAVLEILVPVEHQIGRPVRLAIGIGGLTHLAAVENDVVGKVVDQLESRACAARES